MKFYSLFIFLLGSLCLNAQTYFLNGNALANGADCYTLTDDLNNQNGTVWYGDQINLLQPFTLQFTMNFGSNDANGADGICFVLQTVGTSAIGESGGGMGYLNFGTSLGIEFDTWANGDYNDPGYDHIAIEKNGDLNHNSVNNIAGPILADAFSQNIEDGEDHVVRIEWNPDNHSLRVYFDCVFRLQGDIDLVNAIFQGNSFVYWGFTAATGGAVNVQSVCLQPNILNVGDELIICQGMQPTLSVGSSIDGIYNWSPADFLNDPTSPTPITSTTEDITYTVAFTDLCGDSIVQEIFVNVEPLTITATPLDIINCETTNVQVNMNSNLPLSTAFEVFDAEDNSIVAESNMVPWGATIPGVYTIEANIDSLCFASTTVEIEFDFSVIELGAGDDFVLNCNTPNGVTSGSSNVQNITYNWSLNGQALNNDNTLNLSVVDGGTYVLTALHPTSACLSSDTLLVTEDFIYPTVYLPAQDTLTCFKPVLELYGVEVEAAHDYDAQWTNDVQAAMVGTQTISPSVSEPGLYSVTIIDVVNGCSANASVLIEADDLEPVDEKLLVFPNVISPNQDALNNQWRVALANAPDVSPQEIFKDFNLIVFDRWGRKVAEQSNPSDEWSPTELSEGVYYYTLEYSLLCGESDPKMREGYFHLIR
jgi:gliding motility-associated-like protein